MNTMKSFMKANVQSVPNEKHAISKRFLDEKGEPVLFEFRALDQSLVEKLEDECKFIEGKGKNRVEKTNMTLFTKKLVIESVVYPDFRDPELLKDWDCKTIYQLLSTMFIPGEFAEIAEKVLQINGLGDDVDLLNAAKNS